MLQLAGKTIIGVVSSYYALRIRVIVMKEFAKWLVKTMTVCHVKGTWLVVHAAGNVRINVTLSCLRVTLVAMEKEYYIL
jgi:urea transporter